MGRVQRDKETAAAALKGARLVVAEEITPSCGNVFTDLGLNVCGNCDYHSQEGDDGIGICDGQRTSVKYTCECWAPRRDND